MEDETIMTANLDTNTPTTEAAETTDAGDAPVDGELGKETDHAEISGEGGIVDHPEVPGEEGEVYHPEISTEGAPDQVQEEHVQYEELTGEHLEGEELEGEQAESNQQEEKPPEEEMVEEEEEYVEPPPPDPAAPFDFSDFREAMREPFELRPDQLAEVEQLWALFQDYTPAYTDIDNFITEKELVYMLKALLLMTVTPEQLQELITFCVRPPHPEGHITWEQFLKMVTIRQRDFLIEDEIRAALKVYDPENTGMVDREYLRETLGTLGYKIPPKQIDALIKEVDLTGDGTLGIEDIIGTMCIDLNKEDMQMLRDQAYPKPLVIEPPAEED